MFGSKNREIEKKRLANEYKEAAGQTQSEIDLLKSENPFESAAAKSAMAKASRTSKQMQKRTLNTLGQRGGAEAMMGLQGATNEAAGSAAGQIAVGAEANQQREIAGLRGLRSSQMGRYGSTRTSAIDEKGSGWDTLFKGIEAAGGALTGVGAIT